MKKTTKNILIALAVLLVLCAATVLLLLMPDQNADETGETSTTEQAENEQIIEHSADQVKQITLKNNIVDETWEMVHTDGESVSDFTFKGWEDADVLVSNVSSVARSFYTLYSVKEIEDVTDLAEYGLKGEGEAKAVVEYEDGTTETVIVGVPAGESSGRYVLYDGEVHIASIPSLIEQSKNDFIQTSLLSIVTENKVGDDGTEMEQNTEMDYMYFSGTNYPEEVHIEKKDHKVYTYVMTEPIFAGGGTSQINSIIEQVTTIVASGVAAVNATEEELTEWGMDEPCAVLEYEITGDEQEHVIRLGKEIDGQYSMMLDDDPTIYLMNKSDVDSWVKKDIYDLRETYVYLVNIKEIEKLTVEDENGKSVYDVERFLNEEKSTEEEPFYDIEIQKDKKDVDYKTAYQPFYVSILEVCVLNEETAEPQDDAIFTVTYEYFDGTDTDVVAFYPHPENDRRCVVMLNGQNVGVVRLSDVNGLIENNRIISNFGSLPEV